MAKKLYGTDPDQVPTNADLGTMAYQDSGNVKLEKDSGAALTVERKSDNGDLASFKKDNATVGSIGTSSSGLYIGNASGLRFDDGSNRVLPYNAETPTTTDGTLNLGAATSRFKDLYLSGGVYLGGTGAANKLTDYEEGTWTPSDVSGAGLTFVSTVGTYTKIGRFVFVLCELQYPSTSDTSNMNINGLPFAPIDTFRYGGVMAYTTDDEAGLAQITTNAATKIILRKNGGSTVLQNNELSQKTLRFSISYETTS